jgi:hypothetical protein
LRIAEVDLHIRGYGESLVLGHLQPAISRQRASQGSGEFANLLTPGGNDNFRVFAWHLDQQGKARMTFYQGRHVTVLCTAQQIAFPMAGNRSVFHFRSLSRIEMASTI